MRASRSHALKRTLSTVLIACLPPAAVAGCEDDEEAPSEPAAAATSDPTFSNPAEITNPYLPLSETKKVQLAGEDDGAELVVKRTLLDRTEPFTVGGEQIEAAIVEDRAFEDGELHEVALDYYAQADDGTVYYMGEDVDNYENGKVANHEGAFRYGEETDTLGVAMPANPTVGDEFSFEDVPDVALERNTVASVGGPEALQDGTTYDDVVAIDGYVLPDEEEETKYYARDVGLIREVGPEEEVQLVDGPTAG